MFRLCQKSWSFRARISKDKFCLVTLQDGRQLLLTHVPYLLNLAWVVNALNANLTRFWLTCMFWLPKLISEKRLCGPISIKSECSKRENRESSRLEKTASKSAINCQSKVCLQSSAIGSKQNYLNFGPPQFPELYACNYHTSAHCEMPSQYAFIPL